MVPQGFPSEHFDMTKPKWRLHTMGEDSENKRNYEKDLVGRIQKSDSSAFEELFFTYYNKLCGLAIQYVRSRELAKDCVQEVFLKIWRRRESWEIQYSVRVYLYQAVRNQALNLVEKSKNLQEYSERFYEEKKYQVMSKSNSLTDEELRLVERIWTFVESMPERRKTVFELHRKHGLSYKEIARVMQISRKTVENHMGKALQQIRDNIDFSDH